MEEKLEKMIDYLIPQNEYLNFNWCLGKYHTLSNNSKTVKKTSGGNRTNYTVLGDKVLPHGKISKWKIKMNKGNNSPLTCIGITTKGLDPNTTCNYKNVWSFYTYKVQKDILDSGDKPYTSKVFRVGSIIEVVVDLVKGSLSFIINAVNCGIVCDTLDKEKEYIHFVEIYYEGDKYELLP